jgi:hypothetical protein
MTQDEIIEMAQQAGMTPMKLFGATKFIEVWTPDLLAFAHLVAAVARADEREACADIAENWNSNGFPRTGVANEIRARGTT